MDERRFVVAGGRGARAAWAFVASPPHLANMTDPAWTAVGVGVHYDGATWYITLEFR